MARTPSPEIRAMACQWLDFAVNKGTLKLSDPLDKRAAHVLGFLGGALGLEGDELMELARIPGMMLWGRETASIHEVGSLNRATGTGAWADATE